MAGLLVPVNQSTGKYHQSLFKSTHVHIGTVARLMRHTKDALVCGHHKSAYKTQRPAQSTTHVHFAGLVWDVVPSVL